MEEDDLIKTAKAKYREEQRRKMLDKRNEYRRIWYKKNSEKCREYSREMGRIYYKKKIEEKNKQ